MRVLYIGNFLNNVNGRYDGPNVQVVAMLRDAGHKVSTSGSSGLQTLRLLGFLVSVLKARLDGTQLIIIDVFSTRAFNFAYLSSRLACLLGLPYVLVLHGGNLPTRFDQDAKRSSQLLKNAAKVTSPSAYLAAESEVRFGVDVVVIPNRVDVRPFSNGEKDNHQIFWVRSISPIYNPGMAVDVMERLIKVDKRYKLRMIGPGVHKDMAILQDKIRRKGLEHYIELTGRMSRKDWHSAGESVGYFINTTNVDNTPSSVLEAFALGMVVVSTNVGGIPYIIEHGRNGVIVPSGDAEAMANEILTMNESPEKRERLRLQALDTYKCTYDSGVIAEKWEHLLKRLST